LTGTTQVPDRSNIDVRRGVVVIEVDRPTGRAERARAKQGQFILHLRPNTATLMELSEPLRTCSAKPRAITSTRGKKPKRRGRQRKPATRQLWVHDNGGSWGTKGKFASTTVEGTTWITTDSCHATTVRVLKGRVRVTSRASGRARRVTAPGHVTIHGQ
jgi:hypothetical protein